MTTPHWHIRRERDDRLLTKSCELVQLLRNFERLGAPEGTWLVYFGTVQHGRFVR